MNIYNVRDGGLDFTHNTRYFWVNSTTLDGDTTDFSDLLIISECWRFASYRGTSYRICELGLDEAPDQDFVKVWDKDPFAGFAGIEGFEYLPVLPGNEEPNPPEYAI